MFSIAACAFPSRAGGTFNALSICLFRRAACGARPATRWAVPRASASRRSSGTTRLRKPRASISGAAKVAASSSIWRAVSSPTAPATSCASRGAIGKPRRAMGAPKRAPVAAMRMSQQLAISTPAPMQAPSMRATMGTSQSSMAERPPQTSFSWKSRNCAASNRKAGYSEMSPPAQNAPSAPSISTQRASALRWMLSKTERNWRHMARDMALSRPVWRSVTTTTPAAPASPAAGAATTSAVMFMDSFMAPPPSACGEQAFDVARHRHLALGQLAAVPVDAFEIVQVVHHQPVGLLVPLGRRIARPVEPLHARAVAQVKARHRVHGLAVHQFARQVVRGALQQHLAHRRALVQALCLVKSGQQVRGLRRLETYRPAQLGTSALVQALQHGTGMLAKPGPQARDGRERGEGAQARKLLLQCLHHMLDERVAKAHAAQARLGVADRIEDGGGGLGDIAQRCRLVEQRRDAVGDAVHQRHLDEDQRLIGQARVEEAVAAAVAVQAVLQVGPAADVVHGLVLDELFQQRGGRIPRQATQLQKSHVKPGGEQVLQ